MNNHAKDGMRSNKMFLDIFTDLVYQLTITTLFLNISEIMIEELNRTRESA